MANCRSCGFYVVKLYAASRTCTGGAYESVRVFRDIHTRDELEFVPNCHSFQWQFVCSIRDECQFVPDVNRHLLAIDTCHCTNSVFYLSDNFCDGDLFL